MPVLTGCHCAATATTRSLIAITRSVRIMPPKPLAASQAKHARAREVAARIVAAHSSTITIEDCQYLHLGAVVG